MHPPLCDCPLEAVLELSHSARNPNREFYSCPLKKIKGKKECGYFKWFDVHALEVRERNLVREVANLRMKLADVEEENKQLRLQLRRCEVVDQPCSSSITRTSDSTETSMLEAISQLSYRMSRVEGKLGLR
ncbi:unnamed protein product [Linum trigynum]|uniref:GRF-type domain-containing protein n=1 Tax=Linum trigynum TaxID=586398 RepID=A0AAV2DU00_9ROSI